MADRLRVGVVGLNARVQRQVLPTLAASPRAELAAVASRDAEKARSFAAPFPGCQPFGSYGAMLDGGRLDAVFVMTPPEQHAPMSLAAIRRGLAVMCEKPLAATLDEAREMAAAARAGGVRTAVNFTYRTAPGPRYVARLLGEGAIGDLLDAQVAYLQGRALTQPGPFRDPLTDLAPHLFDALHWWAGPLDRVAAFAAEGAGLPPSWSLAGRFTAGATISMSVSRVAAGRGNALLATLNGRAGALRLAFDTEAVAVSRTVPGSTEWEDLPIPPELRIDYVAFPAAHFNRLVAALQGDEQFPTFDEGLHVQEVIEAARRSAADGGSLRLPLEAP